MVVKIGILGITMILLINEFYPFLDKISSRLRKIILLSIIGLLTLLSIFDIYNDKLEHEQLKKRTEDIYSVAESTNDLQNKSNANILESRAELTSLDSVLKVVNDTLNSQVDLLNQAVVKSKELLNIENTKFGLGRPKISVVSSNVTFSEFFKDSTRMAFQIKARNRGKRSAINVKYGYIFIAFKEKTNIRNIFFGDIGLKSLKDFDSNIELTVKSPFEVSKSEFEKHYGSGILVYRFKYRDEIGKLEYDENSFIGLKKVNNVGSVFHTTSTEEEAKAIRYLRELKLYDYIAK